MAPDTPSNEVLAEILRNIRDESLPSLHAKIDKVNGSIARSQDDIRDLQSFKDQHEGELRTIKGIGGVLATIFGLIIAYLGLKKG